VAIRCFTASVDGKTSFTTNMQAKFEDSTEARGITTYHVLISGCEDNSSGR